MYNQTSTVSVTRWVASQRKQDFIAWICLYLWTHTDAQTHLITLDISQLCFWTKSLHEIEVSALKQSVQVVRIGQSVHNLPWKFHIPSTWSTSTHVLRGPNHSCTQACSCSWVRLCMSHHIVKSWHWCHVCLDDLFFFSDVWWFYKYQADTPGCVITTVWQNTDSLLDLWQWLYSLRKSEIEKQRFEYNCCLNTTDEDERMCKLSLFVYVIASCK